LFRIEKSRVNISEVRELQVTVISAEASATGLTEERVSAAPPQSSPYESAQAKATALLENTRREADALALQSKELLREAQAESERLKNEARQQGFDMGYSEGQAEAQQMFEALTAGHAEVFSNVLADIKHAGDTMISEMEGDIIDLCFSVLRKIAAFDRTTDGEIFKSIIKKAMSQVDLTGKVSIRLSHGDFERFFPNGTAVFDINDTSVTASVTSDPEFVEGDIAVDTESETVLAGAETQLRNIEIAFNHSLGSGNARFG